MDSFDKNINKTFNAIPDSSVPSGYDWQDMEQGIMDKMPDEKPSRKPFIFWALGGVALFLIFGIYNYTDQNLSNEKSNSNLISNKAILKSEKNNEIDQNNASPKPQENTKMLEQKRKSTFVKKANSNTSTSMDVIKNPSNNVQSKTKNVFHQIQNKLIDAEMNTGGESIVIVERSEIETIKLWNKNKKLASNNVSQLQDRSHFNEVAILPTQLKLVKYYAKEPIFKSSKINNLANVQETIKSKKSSSKWPIAVKASSGINIWSGQHKKAPFMDAYSQNKPGYFVDLSLAYEVKPQWYFELGYNHQKLIALFDFEKNDFADYNYKDVILHENTNSLSGQIIQTVGDTTVSAPRHRDVTYYNVLKTHAVKLSLGRRLSLAKKLNIDFSSGLSYLFALEADGYNVDAQEELVHFVSSDNIYKSNQLALGLKVDLSYKLPSNFELSLGLSADKYLSNWSSNNTFVYRPLIVNFKAGIEYKF